MSQKKSKDIPCQDSLSVSQSLSLSLPLFVAFHFLQRLLQDYDGKQNHQGSLRGTWEWQCEIKKQLYHSNEIIFVFRRLQDIEGKSSVSMTNEYILRSILFTMGMFKTPLTENGTSTSAKTRRHCTIDMHLEVIITALGTHPIYKRLSQFMLVRG